MTEQDKREVLEGMKACPFCGSTNLGITDWIDDDGEYDAIECQDCLGAAPAKQWNKRSGAGAPLPLHVQEALNSGDGVYRP